MSRILGNWTRREEIAVGNLDGLEGVCELPYADDAKGLS